MKKERGKVGGVRREGREEGRGGRVGSWEGKTQEEEGTAKGNEKG